MSDETAPKTPAHPAPRQLGATGDMPWRPMAHMECSENFVDILEQQDISLVCTSYQTGRIYLIGRAKDGQLGVQHAMYPQATGLAADVNALHLATLTQIIRLENVLRPDELHQGTHDRVYVPRIAHVTGNLEAHQLGISHNGQSLFTNTLYSCICLPGAVHSFQPVWKPSFISGLVPEDRCHLNGIAMVNGSPKYVSAFGASDRAFGWRDHLDDGGIVIDVESNEIVANGLSMPHSPRLYAGALWLTNSGSGELGYVELASGKFQPVRRFPGYLRGFDIEADFAYVTVSNFRRNQLGNFRLPKRYPDTGAEGWCGLQIVSMLDSEIKGWLRFAGVTTELFDVCILRKVRNPLAIGMQPRDLYPFMTHQGAEAL